MSKQLWELADVHYGQSPAEVLDQDGGIPVIGTGGIYGIANKSLFQGPAIVVPRKGSLGNPQLVEEPFWPADTTYAVVPKARVDASWLYYNLDRFDLRRLNEATGVPSISRGWLNRIAFDDPGPDPQKQIGIILRSIDGLIERTEIIIKKYEQIKYGLMHDLSTRGLDENGELRPPREEAPELYEPCSLGWVPSGWSVKDLGHACDWSSGGTPSRQKTEWWSGDFPWLTPKDMKSFALDDTSEHLTEAAARLGSHIVPSGSVFIVVRGMILAHTFPVVFSSRAFAFNQDIKAVRGREGLDNRFLAYWFCANDQLLLRKVTEATHGTKRFDLKDLYRMGIAIPREPEQQEICKRLDTVSSRIELEMAFIDKLKEMKQGLMHDLLTGEVQMNINVSASGPAHV